MKNRFLIMLFLMVVAVAVGYSQRVHYDFQQDTLTDTVTVYFEFPDQNRSVPGQEAGTMNQWYTLQQTNASGTSSTNNKIEISNFAGKDAWVETGDSVVLTGTQTGLLKNTALNARWVRVKSSQVADGVTYLDLAVRTDKN